MIYILGGERFMKEELFNNRYMPAYITKQTSTALVTISNIQKQMIDVKWGLFGNIRKNGCGIIASYNVLASKSSAITFEDVLLAIKKRRGALLSGLFGVKPWTVYKYLSKKFNSHWRVFFKTKFPNFDQMTKTSDTMIILVKWKGTLAMHYIAGIWQKNIQSDALFKFYNTSVKDDNNLSIDEQPMTIQSFLSLLKKRGHTVLMLMGFSDKKDI